MLHEQDYAAIGRFITDIASAETVIGKLWWHQAFVTGSPVATEKIQGAGMTAKLKNLRRLVSGGSRLEQQCVGLELGHSRVSAARNTLAHGFTSQAGPAPFALNLKDEHQVFMSDLPQLLPWAAYLCELAIQAYADATRGIYQAEQDLPPLAPIIAAPID